ncbi:MAG TPA: type II toxin-antitoxin system VapC family toxin [Thermoanaerobaculia bacterium]|nr:type II toxin-antitoxin system VapC family toxin [Thermoanaerobaculia bacterium]
MLDSSVWIELLTGGDRLPAETPLFADPGALLVSPINLYEVGRYVERVEGREAMERVLASLRRCRVVPLDAETAERAVLLAREHGLHQADALIAATARQHGADLLTFDADLLALPDVREP